jgi:UDP-N-acetylmuramoylalanine--D-glutamate ligase
MKKDVVWIVGGVDKGNNYSELDEMVKDKVKAIICLGENNQKIIKSFQNKVDTIVQASLMSEAVNHAYSLADKGNAVLLSPACASFDLFANYEDRGFKFKKAVRAL